MVGCSSGGERWDEEEEGEIKCRQSGYILTFTNEITDGYVSLIYQSVSPPVTVPRHFMQIPV